PPPTCGACAVLPAAESPMTVSPAALARRPVSSAEPSSTTSTSRTNRQPAVASTTSATVSRSSRAGMTASMVGTQPAILRAPIPCPVPPCRLAGRPRQAGPLTPGHELRRHLAACLVDHLVAEHHRALPLAG